MSLSSPQKSRNKNHNPQGNSCQEKRGLSRGASVRLCGVCGEHVDENYLGVFENCQHCWRFLLACHPFFSSPCLSSRTSPGRFAFHWIKIDNANLFLLSLLVKYACQKESCQRIHYSPSRQALTGITPNRLGRDQEGQAEGPQDRTRHADLNSFIDCLIENTVFARRKGWGIQIKNRF